MSKTAILILNWNNQEFLESFLPGMIAETPADIAEIIVADNGSTDNSILWLKQHHPQIRIIELGKNHGFAGGYNLAIKECSHEIIGIVNSDIEVGRNWLESIHTKLSEPNVAAVMPKILSYNLKDQLEYAGAAGGFIDKFGYPFCRGRIFDSAEKDEGQYNTPIQVHWATGACMFIKRQVFDDAGGFDADFFAHMEEIDLCWRIRRMGFEIWVEPSSFVYHVGGGSLPNESPGKLYLNFRNNLALLYKNLPDSKVFKIMLIRRMLDGVAAAQYIIKGQFRYVGSIIKAHRDFYKWKPSLRAAKKNTHISTKEVDVYQKSIVSEYFLKGRKLFSELNYK